MADSQPLEATLQASPSLFQIAPLPIYVLVAAFLVTLGAPPLAWALFGAAFAVDRVVRPLIAA